VDEPETVASQPCPLQGPQCRNSGPCIGFTEFKAEAQCVLECRPGWGGAKLGQRERAKPSSRILQKIKGMGLSHQHRRQSKNDIRGR
jgi:hypothetical protein